MVSTQAALQELQTQRELEREQAKARATPAPRMMRSLSPVLREAYQ